MATTIASERRRAPLADPEAVVDESGAYFDAIINGVPQQQSGVIYAKFRRGLARRMSIGGSSASVAMAEMKELLTSWDPFDAPAVYDTVKTAMQCVSAPHPDNSDLVLASLLLGRPPTIVRGGQ